MAAITLVMATRNAGKMRELMAELLGDLGVKLLGPGRFSRDSRYSRRGGHFRRKRSWPRPRLWPGLRGIPALADDSGLEVAARGAPPGCFSARYAQDRTAGLIPTEPGQLAKAPG